MCEMSTNIYLLSINFAFLCNYTIKGASAVKIDIRDGCAVCGKMTCYDERKICIRAQVTRSIAKILREFNERVIYESYRCMPLIGGEKDSAPDWEEHIVKYTVVLIKKN